MKVRCTCGRQATAHEKPIETFEGWAKEVYFKCEPCGKIGQRVRGMHRRTVVKLAAEQFKHMCRAMDKEKANAGESQKER